MATQLKNKVALVTGAGRGIGRSISLALAESGAQVVLAARTLKQLQMVEEDIISKGGKARSVQTDLSDDQDILFLYGHIKDEFNKVDVVVNNAALGIFGKLADFPIEDFDRMIQVNLRGLYLSCQQALRLMIPQRSGYIINISSVVGFKGYPNQSAYTATKHGVMGITKSLSVEAQEYNIRVSAILPGGVDTDLAGVGRPDLDRSILIRPEDIAKTVLFLLSLSGQAMIDQIYIRRMTGTPFI
jgi:3-oxoacyl-[acyl-carrier protein] reductase